MRRIATLALLAAACLALAAAPAQASRTLLTEKLLHPASGDPPPEGEIEGACGLAVSPLSDTLYVSDYYHRAVHSFPRFGTFSGSLDGIELTEGRGVMESHTALW